MKFTDVVSDETQRRLRGMVVDWYARRCPEKRLKAIRKQRRRQKCRCGQTLSGGRSNE